MSLVPFVIFHCLLLLCRADECYTGNGEDYRGMMAKTEQGTSCISWTETSFSDVTFAGKGLGEHNYCRNPDRDKKPWCYYGAHSWAYCSVTRCSDTSTSSVPSTTLANNPCVENNGGCQHICNHSAAEVVCDCHQGFELANNSKTECVDVDECKFRGVCSQTCINTERFYACECVTGYRLEERHFCKATGDPELLLTTRMELRRYQLQTKNYTLLVDPSETKSVVAVDFHFQRNYVYWSNSVEKTIKRVSTVTNSIETVMSEKISTPEGLAVDWVHDHLYWTDDDLDQIMVATLDGSMKKVLIEDDLDAPRAIALHPGKGLMFWTDWGHKPKIECCGMNGKHRKIIINERIAWPNGLTIDYVDDRLYWVDAKTDHIESSDLDGRDRRTILSEHQYTTHPFAITVFEDFLYWSDWRSSSVHRYNKFKKGQVTTVLHDLFSRPMDVRIFHPYRQLKYENSCGKNNGGCEHFCLPDPLANFTCECKTGYKVNSQDHNKCVKERRQAKERGSSASVTRRLNQNEALEAVKKL